MGKVRVNNFWLSSLISLAIWSEDDVLSNPGALLILLGEGVVLSGNLGKSL